VRVHVLLLLILAVVLTTLGSQSVGLSATTRTYVDDQEASSSGSMTGERGRLYTSAQGRQASGSQLLTRSIILPSGATGYWLVHDSPTTQIVDDGIARSNHRVIRWGRDGLYAQTRRTYAVFGFRLIKGSPGRMFNWHTTPSDVGGWTPPCSGGGVSPLAIDYWGDSRGLQFIAEPEDDGCSGGRGSYHFPILSQAETEARRGQWIWLWAEITWGRRDLRTKGALKVWVAGEDRPRVNVSGINTHWPRQEMVTFWEGQYHCATCTGRSETHVVEIASTRFGRTPEEAYRDVPRLYYAGSAESGATSAGVAARLSTEAVFLQVVPGRTRVHRDRGCRVFSANGRVVARIADARDNRDTAAVTHRVRQREEAVVSYRLRVAARRLTGPLVVTQLRRADGQILVELYVDRDGTLRLSSPARALRRRGVDLDTGIGVAEAGKVEFRLSRESLLLAVDERPVVRLNDLSGPARGTGLLAGIGIDRYEGNLGEGRIRAFYDELVVGSS
jgi:hypothetical protein